MKARMIVSGTALVLSCAIAIAVGAANLQSQSKAAAAPAVLSGRGFNPQAGEASPEGRLLIGRGQDYSPLPGDPVQLAATFEGSMAERRRAAWRIVEAMLQPQRLTVNGTTYDVPLWHTWYEGMGQNAEVQQRIEMFIGELAACRADPACSRTRAEIAREVVAASPTKNLVRSLAPNNFEQVLTQFRDPGANPSASLGRGFTLFSPSFLEHMLTEAEGVDRCSNRIAWDAPPPSQDQFSPCMREFPRSAVMVKTSWQRLDAANPRISSHDTSAAGVRQVIRNGSWQVPPDTSPAGPSSIYTVEASNGQRYGLASIHFSTKDIRDWVWISLWWSPNPSGDFGQDRPASIGRYNGGVWAHYKMCVTTAFEEGDPAPWSSFAGQPQLAAALRASHEEIATQAGPPPYNRTTTWCSNPNLESHPGNGRTNCIGCHQYSHTWNRETDMQAEFSDTYAREFADQFPQFGRSRRRLNFPAEFAWSFGFEFAPEIRSARQRHHFEW
ncbi:MAG TPA: hypothetical protein VIT38_04440 [Allosphingosinicella sp.]